MKKNKLLIVIIAVLGILACIAGLIFLLKDKAEKEENAKFVSFPEQIKDGDIINILGLDFTYNAKLTIPTARYLNTDVHCDSVTDVVVDDKYNVEFNYSGKKWTFESTRKGADIKTNMQQTEKAGTYSTKKDSNSDVPTVFVNTFRLRLENLTHDGDIKIGKVTLSKNKNNYVWFKDDSTFNLNNVSIAEATFKTDEENNNFKYAKVIFKWIKSNGAKSIRLSIYIDANGNAYKPKELLGTFEYE